MNGKIYEISETAYPEPPLHENCRCEIVPMVSVPAGYSTKDGENGADVFLKRSGLLPGYYITDKKAKTFGWHRGESPAKYVPGKMLTCEEYNNDNKHLPDAPGRIWHEADINYYSGKRNGHRIVWSNDGLIFVTYDHYKTFYEII